MVNTKLAQAIGQPDFEQLLVDHLRAEYRELEFLALGPIYFEDVDYRCTAPHRVTERGDAVADVTLRFIAIEPSQCCSPAAREKAVVKLEVTVAADSGELAIRTIDAPWHLLRSE